MDRDEPSQETACDVPDESPAEDDRAHLADLDASCGCVEVWEHLSERRAANVDSAAADD